MIKVIYEWKLNGPHDTCGQCDKNKCCKYDFDDDIGKDRHKYYFRSYEAELKLPHYSRLIYLLVENIDAPLSRKIYDELDDFYNAQLNNVLTQVCIDNVEFEGDEFKYIPPNGGKYCRILFKVKTFKDWIKSKNAS